MLAHSPRGGFGPHHAVVLAGVVALGVFVGCNKGSDGAAIAWVSSHATGLSRARSAGRPMLLEFTADWCVPCKELERLTYPHPRVRAQAQRFVMVRIDATSPDVQTERLLQRYRVFSLPTILFFDSTGKLLDAPRVTGFESPERFAALMSQVH